MRERQEHVSSFSPDEVTKWTGLAPTEFVQLERAGVLAREDGSACFLAVFGDLVFVGGLLKTGYDLGEALGLLKREWRKKEALGAGRLPSLDDDPWWSGFD